MSGTIADWERGRFETETAQDIANLPITDLASERVAQATPDNPGVIALHGRVTAGLGVQALWSPITGETFITVTLNGETETFAVAPADLAEAFIHPFAYGANLPL